MKEIDSNLKYFIKSNAYNVVKLLEFSGLSSDRIKEVLSSFDGKPTQVNNQQQFTVLERDNYNNITKILKNSTNEVFAKGDTVWSKKWNKPIHNIGFDEFFTGTRCWSNYYINSLVFGSYIGDGGIYPLDEISTLPNINTVTYKV